MRIDDLREGCQIRKTSWIIEHEVRDLRVLLSASNGRYDVDYLEPRLIYDVLQTYHLFSLFDECLCVIRFALQSYLLFMDLITLVIIGSLSFRVVSEQSIIVAAARLHYFG